MKFKYALFDLDMTLIDSIKPLMVSANLLAEKFDLRQVTYAEVYQAEVSVPNCTFELLWQNLWGYCDSKWHEVYRDELAEREYEVMELYPTGRETLETLHKLGVPLGLASNRDYPRRALQCLGLEEFFAVVVGQMDVILPKPAPDMILKAMEQMGAAADELLYVCDSTGDIKAASAAGGVKTFSLTTGGHSAEELRALGAWKTGDRLIEIADFFR